MELTLSGLYLKADVLQAWLVFCCANSADVVIVACEAEAASLNQPHAQVQLLHFSTVPYAKATLVHARKSHDAALLLRHITFLTICIDSLPYSFCSVRQGRDQY